MALMELRRDTISCNSLLNACDKSQQWMLSLHVLETMRTEGIQQDAITFTAVLGACETSDQWAVTMHLLQEVLDGGYCDWQADDIDYVHYFQAGSPYDCLKHMLILHTLTSMVNDASPFLYVDTHAGTGIYDLKSPEAQRFQNHQGGILSLMKVERHAASKALSDYLRLHGIFPRLCRKGSTFEETYLGSPAIAQLFLRPQDAAILFDASPQVASALDRNLQSLSGTSNTEVFCTSSYKWFSKSIKSQYQRYAHLSRVLALIDPPYDSASSSDKWNLFLVKRIRTMWPQSCVLLWYPFVSEGQTKRLDQRLVAMEIGTVLVADLAVSPKNDAPSESRPLVKAFLGTTPRGWQVMLTPPYDTSTIFTFLNGKQFSLRKLEFTSPSENSIDGQSFDMEMQLVHAASDGQMLISSVFLKVGLVDGNEYLSTFWPQFPPKVTPDGTAAQIANPYYAALPGGRSCFIFNGSGTVPPCGTDTIWMVFKEPLVISRAQRDLYRGDEALESEIWRRNG
ncbi:Ribosomal RNA large subunit methyltransferase J (23S rRNA (adenine(2030)-N6)-methyltransferase) (23S rRNA m6A2030 methyltransferase) (ORFJ) [Durusdinium trenchii]|uniref:Ribosomal RNA large subunit methyltransferase J (23S rRNA (Adenine(2030)-N6)-methyltransferase) (23S rRNA m6A2030 methyltransferase) (ORFJ) n=1 Tax=Durusdinium trenchii TaxID=1381693 RepID=A0ABP0KH81_9DINO